MSDKPGLLEAKCYIDELDLDYITDRLLSQQDILNPKWRKADIELAIAYYKNFLFLKKKYEAEHPKLVPSIEIDEIWHQHILYSKHYINDCMNIFGYYMHHTPETVPMLEINKNIFYKQLKKNFQATQELHFKEFNDYIYKII